MQITEQGLLQAIASYRQQEAQARSAADAARGAAMACELLLGVLRKPDPELQTGTTVPTETTPPSDPS